MLHPLLLALSTLIAVSQASITDRLNAAGIDYVTPSDSSWGRYSTPFNKRLSWKPKLIAFPQDASQVSAAVVAGHAENLRVTPRSGGHSYAAYGLGGEDNHLVLDLQHLNSVKVTGDSAVIKPGARLGDTAISLNQQGSVAIPHGVCPYVGVGGHASYGGFGMTSRMWGLTMDRIKNIELVYDTGFISNANATFHDDVFRSLRGAATTFGVITSFTFQTMPQPASATVYQYQWNLNAASAANAFQAWQTFGLSNPTRILGGELNLAKGSKAGTISVSFHGAFYGPVKNLKAAVTPFLNRMPTPASSKITTGDYMSSVATLAGNQKLPSSNIPANGEHDTFYAKSLVTYQASPISKNAFTNFANYLATTGYSSSLHWFAQLILYGGNSAINETPEGGTSYPHRDVLWTIQFYASSSNYAPPYPASGYTFVDNMLSSIVSRQPSGWAYGAYTNYVDDRLKPSEWQKQYYGSEFPLLQQAATIYSSAHVFQFPQAIPGKVPASVAKGR